MKPGLRWIKSLSVRPGIGLLLGVAVLAGCATGPSPDVERPRPGWPDAPIADGRTVFTVDRSASELRVLVAPAGSLARLGHHHVVGGAVLSGRVLLGPRAAETAVDLAVDVGSLVVDRRDWRDDEGFDPIDDDAIEGTRRNLLGPDVLDAERHPRIEIRSVAARGPTWQPEVTARIRIGGTVTERSLPVAVDLDDDRLVAVGGFEIDQTALGLTPFSAAGGALRVADRMTVRFRIVARATGGD